MTADQAKQIHEDLLNLYRALDLKLDERLRHPTAHKPSCQKGCDSCCKIMALCSLAEATTMAWPLLLKPDWRGLLPALRASAEAMAPIGLSEFDYAQKRLPCVFLKDGACSIYSTRPGACRYYYVVTPPSQCDASNTQEVSSIDTLYENAGG